MNLQLTNFQTKKEIEKITNFIKSTLKKQGFGKVIIAVSGGIDSSLCLIILSKTINPKNILVLKLPHGKQNMSLADKIIKQANIPEENITTINIKPIVDKITSCHSGSDQLAEIESKRDLIGLRQLADPSRMTKKNSLQNDTTLQNNTKIRLGNIIARCRMILLYDQAKKLKALVSGTENKSEHLLGYFTRFGDQASDLEPIRHLYKTQVYKLAKYLKIPQQIISQAPSAELWKGQTDEKEMGFTYKEADQVLHLYLEEKLSVEEIEEKGFKNTKKIITHLKNNQFKHKTPYCLL